MWIAGYVTYSGEAAVGIFGVPETTALDDPEGVAHTPLLATVEGGVYDGVIAKLKRAIYDAGYSCKRVTDAGFVGTWQNLDEWTAHCVYDNGSSRDWAIFAGPDGGAQVRDCKDVPGSGLPPCVSKKRPKGSFTFSK